MRRVAIVAVVVLSGLPGKAHAICSAARAVVLKSSRESALHDARAAISLHGGEGHGEARAIYLALLSRDPKDDEATVALARLDAWDGCTELAERGYRSVLERRPKDVEARSGLVDLLLWKRRWDEAEEQMREGLVHTPDAPELLSRRSRLAHWRGDEEAAVADAEAATALSPTDPMLRAQRNALFLGEGRVGLRGQFFPRGYDDIYTFEVDAMQRYRHFRFELGHRIVARSGAFADNTPTDGRRSGGAYYHFRSGAWAGLELAYTRPPIALPRWALTFSAVTPVGSRFTASLGIGLWSYATDKTVYIVAPALSYAVRDGFEVGVRYWISSVQASVAGQPSLSETVHSVGLRTVFTLDPTLLVGAEYTFGVQLDQNPTLAQFLQLRSHILTGFARKMFTPQLGIAPVVAMEIRQNVDNGQVIVIPLFETSFLVRW